MNCNVLAHLAGCGVNFYCTNYQQVWQYYVRSIPAFMRAYSSTLFFVIYLFSDVNEGVAISISSYVFILSISITITISQK